MIRFLWVATRGHRLAPWNSPYLRWRIETYWGLHAERLTAPQVRSFVWQHRAELWGFLRWASHMGSKN